MLLTGPSACPHVVLAALGKLVAQECREAVAAAGAALGLR